MSKTVTIEQFAKPLPWWSTPSFEHPVFLAFQGGGARGISHVGGLAAVNELRLRIVGVAGTSAGAIVAALIAAGYKADDLLNPDTRTHLLKVVAGGKYKQATSLFTEDGWKEIKLWRDLGKPSSWLSKILRHKLKTLLLVLLLLLGVPNPPLLGLGIIGLGGYVYRRLVRTHDGLASLTDVRELANSAIAERMRLDPRGANGHGITFGQMHHAGGLPLKLVATNVTDQALELFSFETTPDVAVADAVAASICLPFVFKPWSFVYKRVGDSRAICRRFLDGGLMSNLPAWSFDEERALSPTAVTIAFGLSTPDETARLELDSAGSKTRKQPHWFFAALNTVVAGPPELHFRGIDRLVQVQLASTIKVLDFDAPFSDLAADVLAARRDAKAVLLEQLTYAPRLFREYLDRMRMEVQPELYRFIHGDEYRGEGSLRITVAIQRATDRKSMAVAYATEHKVMPLRQRLSLDIGTMTGRAWVQGDRLRRAVPMTTAADAIYPDSAWAVAVPVPIYNPDADEAGLADYAVVAIFDSPEQLPAIIEGTAFDIFCRKLYALASVYFIVGDFGRTCRRSVTWLG